LPSDPNLTDIFSLEDAHRNLSAFQINHRGAVKSINIMISGTFFTNCTLFQPVIRDRLPFVLPGGTKYKTPFSMHSEQRGFWTDIYHFRSSFLIGLKEETWFGSITEFRLHLTHLKVKVNWSLCLLVTQWLNDEAYLA